MSRSLRMILTLACMFIAVFSACSKREVRPVMSGAESDIATDTQDEAASDRCKRPNNLSAPITSLKDLITILNALPKPTSVSCMIDVLDRPLRIAATSNAFSGQPGTGSENPRIFILANDRLEISVVPSGSNSTVVEFAYRTDVSHSIKSEIHFPLTTETSEVAAYEAILNPALSGTSACGICHFPETAAPDGFPSQALVSRIIPLDTRYEVPMSKLKELHASCQSNPIDGCLILNAIFRDDQVTRFDFNTLSQ